MPHLVAWTLPCINSFAYGKFTGNTLSLNILLHVFFTLERPTAVYISQLIKLRGFTIADFIASWFLPRAKRWNRRITGYITVSQQSASIANDAPPSSAHPTGYSIFSVCFSFHFESISWNVGLSTTNYVTIQHIFNSATSHWYQVFVEEVSIAMDGYRKPTWTYSRRLLE